MPQPPTCLACRGRAARPGSRFCWADGCLCWRLCAACEDLPHAAGEALCPACARQLARGRERRPARRPTAALPGSAAKILVLQERFAAGVALWHPRDEAGAVGAVSAAALAGLFAGVRRKGRLYEARVRKGGAGGWAKLTGRGRRKAAPETAVILGRFPAPEQAAAAIRAFREGRDQRRAA